LDFYKFPKIARLNREIIVTEKIDGSNGQIFITPDLQFFVGSRSRWITSDQDNYGFARWAYQYKDELIASLGEGLHYGEWWGSGINRGYGLTKGEKRFSLFNTLRWNNDNVGPAGVVPVLYEGIFSQNKINDCLALLNEHGSFAAPGYMKPEGIIIFHTAANLYLKVTLENDETPKKLIIIRDNKE
jgi:hypothetical protein